MSSNLSTNMHTSVSHNCFASKKASLVPENSVSDKRHSVIKEMSKSSSRYFDFLHRRSTVSTRPALSNSNSRQIFEKEQKEVPTYQTEPRHKFKVDEVNGIIYDVLADHLKDRSYSSIHGGQLSIEMSQTIQNEVKLRQKLERYKIVTSIWLGQNRGQGTNVASRCLWNSDFDNYASATFTNETIFAIGLVFATYVD
ncbi:Tctex1 domain-containing protein 1-B [Trichoplax sp. H2]|uniref:Dynein light chain n=1 Tax=Trichoplax adhaerens TaxID=10228 RepID=B3S2I9_TRIAD|nr:hypothetical protein TRIADDRAFT_58042 [Trichoplax adhaerens]EDV23102.1 hypothetical protein TRIADDRAFT_58042 [Trichoplax adhaerens]RDD47834.1 Tctex1 domain-containing protein 1-B [Trichoplax sp. H2]|eukprot:XP_002114012.1 hypothetical protein TRIADDRAFT_58042 [Trichoplax adhaerens]